MSRSTPASACVCVVVAGDVLEGELRREGGGGAALGGAVSGAVVGRRRRARGIGERRQLTGTLLRGDVPRQDLSGSSPSGKASRRVLASSSRCRPSLLVLLVLAGFERQLVRHQGGDVGRIGHGEVGRQVAVEKAGGAQLGEAGQILDPLEAEVAEEGVRRAVGDGTARARGGGRAGAPSRSPAECRACRPRSSRRGFPRSRRASPAGDRR